MNLVYRSLQLDIHMLSLPMCLVKKIEFILKKYFLIAKNILFGFTVNKSNITLFNDKYYYDDMYGIAFLQSVFVDHYNLIRFIKPGGVVVDIGANIGQFNFFARHVLGANRVYSFEPIPYTYSTLKLNAHHDTFNLAISSVDGESTFYVPDTSLMASSYITSDNSKIVEVSCKRIDDIHEVACLKEISLVKIDTEGSELDVVKASIEIMKFAEYVLIEASVLRECDGDILSLMSFVKENIPQLSLIWLGRCFDSDDGTTMAVDCLFKNRSLSK